MQSEVHVELDWVYAREPVSELSGTVEDASSVRIVGSGGIINITFAPFPTASSLRSFLKVPGGTLTYAAVISSLTLRSLGSSRSQA